MNLSQDIDSLITKYVSDLMEMKEKWSKWGIVTQEEKVETAEEMTPKTTDTSPRDSSDEGEAEKEIAQEIREETPSVSDDETAEISDDYPVANPEFYANFKARVFSGDQAYPVPNAKVLLYLDGRIHTFLMTNENGETPLVKIESAPGENALIPNSDNQQLDYMADVFADGFTEKKGLLVSAVGDSDILLNVQLTPLSERID